VRGAGGLRRSARGILTQDEVTHLTQEFIEIGGDPQVLQFNSGSQTGYVDRLDVIYVRGDVMPIPDSPHPRSAMSPRAVLAHERGHQNYRFTPVQQGAWNDEFRASYWAAKNVPNLSDTDRIHLIQDALTRAQEAGVPIRYNSFIRQILYGY
jgi:hypothetical protein